MTLNIKNRAQLSLLIFVLGDAALWWLGPHCEYVFWPWQLGAAMARLAVLGAFLYSFYSTKYLHKTLTLLSAYAFIMVPIHYLGANNYSRTGELLPDVIGFRSEALQPVTSGFAGVIFYVLYLVSMYFFAWRHVPLQADRESQ